MKRFPGYSDAVEPRLARCILLADVLAADGIMAPEEKVFLARAMEASRLTDQEKRLVHGLEMVDQAIDVLSALPEGQRRAIGDQLVEATLVDGKLSPHETKAVQRLFQRLGLD